MSMCLVQLSLPGYRGNKQRLHSWCWWSGIHRGHRSQRLHKDRNRAGSSYAVSPLMHLRQVLLPLAMLPPGFSMASRLTACLMGCLLVMALSPHPICNLQSINLEPVLTYPRAGLSITANTLCTWDSFSPQRCTMANDARAPWICMCLILN